MARALKPMAPPDPDLPLTPERIGQFVRAKRTQSGLRIDDAAQLCGVTKETLSRIETAKSSIRLDNLFKVLNGLGLELYMKRWSEKGIDENG